MVKLAEKFCFLWDLKYGSFVCGYTFLLLDILTLLYCFITILGDGLVLYKILGGIVTIGIDCLLIYGTKKDIAVLLLVFLVWKAISLVLGVIGIIITGVAFTKIFVTILAVGLMAYLWYSVLCYYNVLSKRQPQGGKSTSFPTNV